MKAGIDYIGTSAGVVIQDDSGKYFLAKRGRGARDDVGKWEFPGGSVKLYETREDAAVRNVLEKYALDIDTTGILSVYDVIDKRNKDHWLSTTFMCKARNPKKATIIDLEKCTEIGWFTLRAIAYDPKASARRLFLLSINSCSCYGSVLFASNRLFFL